MSAFSGNVKGIAVPDGAGEKRYLLILRDFADDFLPGIGGVALCF
jgi:hypothetical protein